ncbi:MAG: hypothetical protein EOM06_14540, partial [Sphingobacteriia bacterium]|nr:hypothetical protein [Sphingobacteriia bacterium]
MKDGKAYKYAFFLVILMLSGSLYMSFGYFSRLQEAQTETVFLQQDIDSLKARADSLIKVSNQVQPSNAVIIKEKIITKYIRQYEEVANANANEAYLYLTDWIPISDSLPQMVVSSGGDTCVIVRSSQ